MFYVYILFSDKFDRFYIGQTNNIESRLLRHNKGYVKSTKAYKPWDLIHTERFSSRSDALKRESYLKSLKSKSKLIELVDASR